MDALYRELESLVSQDQIDGGGLRIYTSLDPDLQRTAEQSVDSWLTQVENKPGYKYPKTDFGSQHGQPKSDQLSPGRGGGD